MHLKVLASRVAKRGDSIEAQFAARVQTVCYFRIPSKDAPTRVSMVTGLCRLGQLRSFKKACAAAWAFVAFII